MSTVLLEMPTLPPTRTDPPAPAHLDRIILTGFMGSGKTTAGRLLAERLGWTFLDLDREIEARQLRSGDPAITVPEIFAQHGEARFRRLEAQALAILLGRRHVVIALGGGAPEELGNRLLLEQTPRTAVIHLAAPLDVLLERCRIQSIRPGSVVRPVLADLEAATHRYFQRLPLYNRLATHRIDTSTHNHATTVTAILTALGSRSE
jgi:shikimate kinase